ncbi:MAG: hypothetical protein GYA34_05375 [Chloroflexi bacterium]|nr:hypothetical protein [Chloroflexota bacterium]
MNIGNNIDADLLFIMPGNLRLQPGSPAIDTGDNSVVSVPINLDGIKRVIGGNRDRMAVVGMGACQRQMTIYLF